MKWIQFTKDYYVPIDYLGTPQIDHFYCLNHFDLTNMNDYKLANHWSNLRYVTSEENLSKHKRNPTPDEIFKHDSIKKMFLDSLEKEKKEESEISDNESVVSEKTIEIESDSDSNSCSEKAEEFGDFVSKEESEKKLNKEKVDLLNLLDNEIQSISNLVN